MNPAGHVNSISTLDRCRTHPNGCAAAPGSCCPLDLSPIVTIVGQICGQLSVGTEERISQPLRPQSKIRLDKNTRKITARVFHGAQFAIPSSASHDLSPRFETSRTDQLHVRVGANTTVPGTRSYGRLLLKYRVGDAWYSSNKYTTLELSTEYRPRPQQTLPPTGRRPFRSPSNSMRLI